MQPTIVVRGEASREVPPEQAVFSVSVTVRGHDRSAVVAKLADRADDLRAALDAYGDAIDFWRVTGVEPGRRLALRAEMRLPGQALLEFTIEPLSGRADRVRLVQTARFLPRGLFGLAYWYAVLPLHHVVFGRLLRGIQGAAEVGTLRPPAHLTP